jgi:hypothetical protein
VVAKLREKLAVRKQAAQKFEGESFNLGKLKELEVKEKYQIEITNRFAALENLIVDEHVNRIWENKRISKPQLKRAWVCTNGSSINHGLTRRLKCSGYRIQAEAM